MITKKRHKRELQENLQILNNIISGSDAGYPGLRELFLLKSGKHKGEPNALYNKLVCLHDYALNYEDDGEKKMEDAGRGWEWYASQDKLVELYGSNKETWKSAINKLYFLGLIGIYKPADGRESNTPGQQYSAERAKQGAAIENIKAAMLDYGYSNEAIDGLKCHPCTWYRILHYTKKALAYAESRVSLVKAGAAVDKDSMRDALGADQANMITDTGYPMHQETEIRRYVLSIELNLMLGKYGYATKERVIAAAYERAKGEFGSVYRWRDTWKGYKRALFEKYNLRESRPTKEEKKKYKLKDDSWIIRERK